MGRETKAGADRVPAGGVTHRSKPRAGGSAALRIELLQRILQNSPAFFEELIIDLLVKMGYGGSRPDAAAQLGRSGDGGVDGVINEDRLGLDRVYLQAKGTRKEPSEDRMFRNS